MDLVFFECPSLMERRSSNAVAARKEETEGDVAARNVSVLALKRVLQMTPRPACSVISSSGGLCFGIS